MQQQARRIQGTVLRPMIVLGWLQKGQGVNLEEQLLQNTEYGFVPLDIEHPH